MNLQFLKLESILQGSKRSKLPELRNDERQQY